MTETLKLLKKFALISLLMLCVIGLVCGVIMVDTNTRFLTLGDPGQLVGIALDKQTVTLRWDTKSLALPPLSEAVQVLRLSPAPLGSLIAFGESIWQAAAQFIQK